MTRHGRSLRHHLHKPLVQRAVRPSALDANITKAAPPHADSFPTDLLEGGDDLRTIQELRGYRDVATTMIYTHVLNRSLAGVRSPRDV